LRGILSLESLETVRRWADGDWTWLLREKCR